MWGELEEGAFLLVLVKTEATTGNGIWATCHFGYMPNLALFQSGHTMFLLHMRQVVDCLWVILVNGALALQLLAFLGSIRSSHFRIVFPLSVPTCS